MDSSKIYCVLNYFWPLLRISWNIVWSDRRNWKTLFEIWRALGLGKGSLWSFGEGAFLWRSLWWMTRCISWSVIYKHHRYQLFIYHELKLHHRIYSSLASPQNHFNPSIFQILPSTIQIDVTRFKSFQICIQLCAISLSCQFLDYPRAHIHHPFPLTLDWLHLASSFIRK